MKNQKKLLIAAAVSGALAAFAVPAQADQPNDLSRPIAEKQGCHGKSSCQSKDKQGKKKTDRDKKKGDRDKSACAGKDGCGGKDKQS